MSKIADDPLVGLFVRIRTPHPCRCGETGYCPACGTYTPPQVDHEVLDALADNARQRNVGSWQRKHLKED